MTTTSTKSEIHPLWLTLKLTFGLVPIVAGVDKFTNLLTDWTKYLPVKLSSMLSLEPHTFMYIVGVIEIAAGVIVLLKTELGAYIVAAWLVGIALTLLLSGSYLDVAVRDIVMAIGAVTLARLTKITASTSI